MKLSAVRSPNGEEGYDTRGTGDANFSGELFMLEDGEYVQAEAENRQVVLVWTSRDDAAGILKAAVQLVGAPPDRARAEVSLVGDDGVTHRRRRAQKIVQKILHGEHVGLFTIEFGDFTFAWRAPMAKFADYDTPRSECAVVRKREWPASLLMLIAETATKGIASEGEAILKTLDLVQES